MLPPHPVTVYTRLTLRAIDNSMINTIQLLRTGGSTQPKAIEELQRKEEALNEKGMHAWSVLRLLTLQVTLTRPGPALQKKLKEFPRHRESVDANIK